MPLVLHGGSGSGDENIKRCVEFGINKINVGCDFMNANVDSIKQHLKKRSRHQLLGNDASGGD